MRITTVFSFVLPALLASFIYFYWPQRASLDCAMYLTAAEEWLNGAKLYVDIIDINPPLVIYMSAIPVLIARWVGLHSATTLNALTLGSVFLSAFFIRNALRNLSTGRRDLVSGLWIFQSAVMNGLITYGQREHFFSLFFFPYLLNRLHHIEKNGKERVLAFFLGLLCGLVSCLKPYFIITVLASELAHSQKLKDRVLRPDFLGFSTSCLFYGMHFLLLPQEISRAFFQDLVPMVIERYSTFDFDGSILIHTTSLPIYLCALIWAAAIFMSPEKKEVRVLAAAGFISAFFYFFQNKAFSYHNLPALFSAVLVAGMEVSFSIQKMVPRAVLTLAFLGIIIPSSGGSILRVVKDELFADNDVSVSQRITHSYLRHSKTKDRVLIFSANPRYAFPGLNAYDRLPGSRYLFMFPLAFFTHRKDIDETIPYPYTPYEEMRGNERDYVRRIQEDIHFRRPKLIVLVHHHLEKYSYLNRNFSVIDYLRNSGIMDSIDANYALVESTREYAVYKSLQPGIDVSYDGSNE